MCWGCREREVGCRWKYWNCAVYSGEEEVQVGLWGLEGKDVPLDQARDMTLGRSHVFVKTLHSLLWSIPSHVGHPIDSSTSMQAQVRLVESLGLVLVEGSSGDTSQMDHYTPP